MTKNLFKFVMIVTLITAVLLTAACSGAVADDRTFGRYLEIDITPPIDGRFISLVTHDGNLAAFDEGLQTRFDSSNNGETWTQTTGPGSGTDRFAGVRTAAFLPDGRLLVYVQGEGIVALVEDGSSTHFPIDEIDNAILEGEDVSVSLIQVLDSERVLLTYTIGGFGGFIIGPGDGSQRFSINPEDFNLTDFDMGEISEVFEGLEISAADLDSIDLGSLDLGAFAGAFDLSALDFDSLDLDSLDLDALGIDIDTLMSMIGDSAEPTHFTGQQVMGGRVRMDTVEGDNLQLPNMANIRAAAQDQTITRNFSFEGMVGGMGGMGQTTTIHNIATGSLISEVSVPNALTTNAYGDIYTYDGHHILRNYTSGSVSTLLDGAAFSFGAQNVSVSAMQILPNYEQSFIINTLVGWQHNRLYKYTWDENAPIDPNKTITIWSLEDNAFVRAAITEMWRQHPDAYITYEIALSGDTAVSASDAIRTLNTRLLSGSGPDILILDGTPIESYAGRGMLLDLSEADTDKIYQNLLEPFVFDGRTYVIPTQFSIPVLMSDASILEETQTLDALVNRVLRGNPTAPVMHGRGLLGATPAEERSELYFENLEELYEIMWLTSARAFINNNQLDSDSLREFLAAMEAISNMYNLTEPRETPVAMGMSVVVMSTGGGMTNMFSGSLVQYLAHTTNMGAFSIEHLTMLQLFMERSDADITAFPGLAPGAWQPSTMVGISADTAVAEFAMEFINTMLSTNVQQINHGEGLPITREGIAVQIDTLNDALVSAGGDPFEMDLDDLISQLQIPALMETVLREMIWETVERLCTGRIDLEGAVREVEQNIRNYLAERS